jgi:hypothetical protein
MKNKRTTLIDAITKKRSACLTMRITKAVILFLLFAVSGMKGQTPPTVAPYPATELGQTMLIDESSEYWTPAMDQASTVRAELQAFIDHNPGIDPVMSWSCVGDVCCRTEPVTINGTTYYITVCFNNSGSLERIVFQ